MMTDGDVVHDEIIPRRSMLKSEKITPKSKIPTSVTNKLNKSKIPVKGSRPNTDIYTIAAPPPSLPIKHHINFNSCNNNNNGYTIMPTSKINEDIYTIAPTAKHEDGSSLEDISAMEKENNKHLSWDSGNSEETSASWFNEENDGKNLTPVWNEANKDVSSSIDESSGFFDDVSNNTDTPDTKILSWHTLSIMTLQNMIIDQSEKIKQLEMNCHLQEILMKNQKDEIDLYQERVDQLETQSKEDKEEKQFVLERIENLENLIRYQPQQQQLQQQEQQEQRDSENEELLNKVNTLETELEVHRVDKIELIEKVERLESTIDEHKEEMDLLLERIDDSMKTHSKEMDYLTDRADTFEEFAGQHKQEQVNHSQRLDTVELVMKNLSSEAMELVSERLDNLVIAFEQNKKEKEILLERIEEEIELFLERVANLEVALHNVEKYGGIVIPDREVDREAALHTQEAISDLHSKVIDTYTDTEAALNVIHNMLHKDKLTKII